MGKIPMLKSRCYREEGTETAPSYPALLGGECSCGYVFYPMQTYGCEKCGRHGDELTPKALSGLGVLVSSAKVHLHAGKRPAPFVICAVKLDDGPVVRAVLDDVNTELEPGDVMVTKLVHAMDPETGDARKDLRFSKLTDGEG